MSYPDFKDLDKAQAAVDVYPYDASQPAWQDIRIKGAGTCSDYVLGKIAMLCDLSWPIEKLQIGIVLVEPENRNPGETHAILYVDDDHVLDQRQMGVVSLTELQRIGYEPVEIQKIGGSRQFVEWIWG